MLCTQHSFSTVIKWFLCLTMKLDLYDTKLVIFDYFKRELLSDIFTKYVDLVGSVLRCYPGKLLVCLHLWLGIQNVWGSTSKFVLNLHNKHLLHETVLHRGKSSRWLQRMYQVVPWYWISHDSSKTIYRFHNKVLDLHKIWNAKILISQRYPNYMERFVNNDLKSVQEIFRNDFSKHF